MTASTIPLRGPTISRQAASSLAMQRSRRPERLRARRRSRCCSGPASMNSSRNDTPWSSWSTRPAHHGQATIRSNSMIDGAASIARARRADPTCVARNCERSPREPATRHEGSLSASVRPERCLTRSTARRFPRHPIIESASTTVCLARHVSSCHIGPDDRCVACLTRCRKCV
jgi:hypothetical protein